MLADKCRCNKCGIVIFMDTANDYCPRCNKSTEWTDLEVDVEITEDQLGKAELYIYVSDETQAWEQQGYDVDIWEDNQNGRNEELSIVGMTKEKAEEYVEELKQKYNVVSVKWQ